MNKCKVTIITVDGNKFQENLSCKPYEAIELLCKLKRKICNKNKIMKTIDGYEYCLRGNNSIIFAQ